MSPCRRPLGTALLPRLRWRKQPPPSRRREAGGFPGEGRRERAGPNALAASAPPGPAPAPPAADVRWVGVGGRPAPAPLRGVAMCSAPSRPSRASQGRRRPGLGGRVGSETCASAQAPWPDDTACVSKMAAAMDVDTPSGTNSGAGKKRFEVKKVGSRQRLPRGSLEKHGSGWQALG